MLQMAGWMIAEAGIGLATGLAVSFLIEAVTMAAQAVSTQAGFAFASTVDPNTEADSTVLILIAQLTAAMLFFALGLDRQLLSILARSLETHPPGSITSSRASAEALVMLGSGHLHHRPSIGVAFDGAPVPDRSFGRLAGPFEQLNCS